jgi:hypothetical protein
MWMLKRRLGAAEAINAFMMASQQHRNARYSRHPIAADMLLAPFQLLQPLTVTSNQRSVTAVIEVLPKSSAAYSHHLQLQLQRGQQSQEG